MTTSDKDKRGRGEDQVLPRNCKKKRDNSSVSRQTKSSSSFSTGGVKKIKDGKEVRINSQPYDSGSCDRLSLSASIGTELKSAGGIQFSPQTGERMERCFSRIATKIGEEAKEDLQE
jgi:hypothetical protein